MLNMKAHFPKLAALFGHRSRGIFHASAWSLAAKCAGAANLFVSVPFVLHALGPAQFGAWATLVSLVMFAGFLDFGIGNGTMNLVASAHGRGATSEVDTIVREGQRSLLRIALWLAIGVLAALPLLPWYRLLGLPQTMADTARAAIAVVLFSIVLAVPLNLAARVQLGIGRGDRAFRWQTVGQLLALGVVIGLAKAQSSLVVLTAATLATPLLAALVNTWLLRRDLLAGAPGPSAPNPEIAANIKREGLLFFVLQLAASLAFAIDLPLISALRSPAEAGTYAVVQRLFSIVPLALSLIWVPLWPFYRQALASGNHSWVIRTLRRSVLLATLVASASALVLVLGFDRIVGLWIHRPIAVTGVLLAGFAVWCIVDAAGTAIATFLNAASIMRYQVIVATIFATMCLGGKAWAIVHFGIDAIPWVAATTYILASLLPALLFGPRIVAAALAKTY
jgi:O-antigen/teichoic acid export membrane protein